MLISAVNALIMQIRLPNIDKEGPKHEWLSVYEISLLFGICDIFHVEVKSSAGLTVVSSVSYHRSLGTERSTSATCYEYLTIDFNANSETVLND